MLTFSSSSREDLEEVLQQEGSGVGYKLSSERLNKLFGPILRSEVCSLLEVW
jgi:hypothetical protein